MQGASVWKKVWDLACPAKVKIFTWKTLHDTLPCGVNLAHRHVKISPQCPFCKEGADTTAHVMFQCIAKVNAWKDLGVEKVIRKACLVYRAGESVLGFPLEMAQHEMMGLNLVNIHEMIANTCWYLLWWERRKLWHREKIQSANQIASSVRILTVNYSSAIAPKAKRKQGGWELPPRGYVNLNVDTYFDQDLLKGTAGAIIRDDRGEFIDIGNWKIDFCHDVVSAEATAPRYGLSLAQTIGCNKIIVNSDNIVVVNKMNETGRSTGPAAAIFDDCYHMACEFTYTSFMHCPREANMIAHELANLAKGPSCNSFFSTSP
jgi:hypothetical protein